ncbi:MAG: homocysteine S-methyltransferase family protein [Candidatus Saccharimonadales bacterium]
MAKQSLMDRLKNGAGSVLCGEGYLFQMQHRGYLKAGAYVPEVVLEHPEVVEQLHEEFRRCGTDVEVAFTYYAHREKMKAIGRKDDLEKMNRAALKLAKKSAQGTDMLITGNICNTGAYVIDNQAAADEVRRQFSEQVKWAAEEGVDFILAETISYLGEALIALEVIKKFDLPAVINFTAHGAKSKDGHGWAEACKTLQDNGADVVGLNCGRGPAAMLPLLKEIRAAVSCGVAALPVAYRTTPEQPSFQSLKNADGSSAYTLGLDAHLCTRQEMADFAREAKDIGVEFIGMCCGGEAYHLRAMAKALGRSTIASQYSPDMSQHYILGNKAFAKQQEQEFTGHITK